MEMERVFILALVNILSLAFVAFVAFVGGRLYESYRQQEKALDKEMENLKQSEQMLRLVKLAASKSATATDKSEPAPATAAEKTAKTIGAKAAQPRDKGGRFEKSKRDDNPRK